MERRSGEGTRNPPAEGAKQPDVVRRWLEEALGRMRTVLPEAVGMDLSPETLTAIVSEVRNSLLELPPPESAELDDETERLVTLTRGRTLSLLRTELLDGWDSDDRAADRVAVLRRLEDLKTSLAPPWADALSPFSAAKGGELVVQLAHDLRSPLTSILFLAETLGRGHSGELNDQQKRQIGLIYAAALGLSSISGDVMELARGGAGLVEDQPTPFSVGEIFDAVKNMVLPLAEEKQLALLISNPASDHWNGHPLALSRVLLNLTTNALKFTDTGHVEIGARATGLSSVEFWVEDTGRGIPQHAEGDLFKMFRQVPNRGRTHFSGTGLGLHICQQLVGAMGSKLQYRTSEGEGTRFHFELRLSSAVRI